jgi:hypothetical protein
MRPAQNLRTFPHVDAVIGVNPGPGIGNGLLAYAGISAQSPTSPMVSDWHVSCTSCAEKSSSIMQPRVVRGVDRQPQPLTEAHHQRAPPMIIK